MICLAIPQEYNGNENNQLFMKYPHEQQQQLSRRESYPNLVSKL